MANCSQHTPFMVLTNEQTSKTYKQITQTVQKCLFRNQPYHFTINAFKHNKTTNVDGYINVLKSFLIVFS